MKYRLNLITNGEIISRLEVASTEEDRRILEETLCKLGRFAAAHDYLFQFYTTEDQK